ncbi:MAG: orotidine-5'-phosphate decarboxylase [Cytophagales bacterium]
MNYQQLFEFVKTQKSYLCVGLDSDIDKIPKHLLIESDAIFEFNKQIIDATAPFCVAFKPNTAFYEALGSIGWSSLEKTIKYLNKNYPNHFTIADAKRGDIGNTSAMYAKAFFEGMSFDSITVAPYMGKDSVDPFLGFDKKWVILLALTSNSGSRDFEELVLINEESKLYEKVLKESQKWANEQQMMYVVGATKAEMLKKIREIVPNHFLLVPGVGAQGGSLEEVSKYGMNKWCGLLVNSSRGIIYASGEEDFAIKAGKEAQKMQLEMAKYLELYL